MQFTLKTFQALEIEELYGILQLRQAVFIVEQDCPYLDADGKDQASLHLMGRDHQGIVAYARILPKGLSYEDYPSIGRILIASRARGKGFGQQLVQEAINIIERQWAAKAIKISAQSYLLKFYQDLGFQVIGAEYLEDGIPHHAMIRSN